uniref:Kinesin-like protein n=1 Tax=Panagrolaimus sp. ES5 TaxID=591445 RepID=A0AC34F1U3_9BILA
MNRQKDSKKTKRKNVQVAIRIRPLNEMEKSEKGKAVATCDRVTKMVSMMAPKEQKFFGPFDWVYGSEASQTDIYMDIVNPLIQEVLSGYNCTVFAYGQTGTGKTFTMEGRHDDNNEYSWEDDPTAGIIPRALHHIFSELTALALDDYCVRVSYVELYNEELYDLLATGNVDDQTRLRIFDDKTHNGNGVLINGLTEVAVRSRDEVYCLLKRGAERRRTASTLMNMSSSRSHSVFTRGAERRRTASTLMNMSSSRSHSVFTVSVLFRDNTTSKSEELLLKTGKLHLVDLAGSESIGRSGAVSARAREAGNINQSLLTLGRVINALTTNASHIPYRESKLTRILQDSLGGKTITTIIATLSPSSTNLEESISTLEYSTRAKNIKNNPEVNQQVTRKALLKEYNEEIEKLRKDLAAAREKNGIFLAQENYDQIQEQMTENNARIEDLEGQLMAFMDKQQAIMNDLEFMEGQYELTYRKHLNAIEKLEKRRAELKREKEEHNRAQKELLATKLALEQSNNKSTQLYAQAVQVNESNMVIGSELEILYNKFEECKTIFEKNDKLFGQFSARRIHDSHQIKDKISNCAQTSATSISSLKRMCQNLEESVTQRLNSVTDDVNKIYSHAMKFNEETEEYLENYTTYAKESGEKHLAKIEAKYETVQNYCLEILKHVKNEVSMVEQFSNLVASYENNMKSLLNFYQNNYQTHNEENNEIYDQVISLMNKLKSSNDIMKQKTTVFVEEETKVVKDNATAWTNMKSQISECHNEIIDITTEEQKALELIVESDKKYAHEQLEMAEGVKTSLNESAKELSTVVTDKCGNVNTITENTVEVCGKKTAKMVTANDTLGDSIASITTDMDAHLTTSQQDMERFIHQEVLRYSSGGDTPVKKKRHFGVELTPIPSVQELLNQYSSQSPVRQSTYKVRESLLMPENSTVMSPSALKQRLGSYKQNENEQTETMSEE